MTGAMHRRWWEAASSQRQPSLSSKATSTYDDDMATRAAAGKEAYSKGSSLEELKISLRNSGAVRVEFRAETLYLQDDSAQTGLARVLFALIINERIV